MLSSCWVRTGRVRTGRVRTGRVRTARVRTGLVRTGKYGQWTGHVRISDLRSS